MYQFNDIGVGRGGGAAALPFPRQSLRDSSFGRKGGAAVALVPPRFSLAVDLGRDIGSARWWRGLATCTALCWAAWSLAPRIAPIAQAGEPVSDVQWQESRALAVSPLAYGSRTGRRMAETDAVEPLLDAPERPSVSLFASLSGGGDLRSALERAGVASAEAEQVTSLVAGAVPPADIAPGTVLDLTLGRRPSRDVARPLDSLAFRARFDLKLSLQRIGGRLVLNRIPIAVDETPLRIQGIVGPSLYLSARAAGVPASAVETYLRALAAQVNVGSLNAGDRFDMVMEHRRAATGESETGRLLYAGLDRSGSSPVQLLLWSLGGKSQWFEASGVGKQTSGLTQPVPGMITSGFGERFHPILGYFRMHKGVDFHASWGTPILAATDGRVARAGWAGGYGNQVRIEHGGGLSTSYSHMSRIAAAAGSFVRQGQVIGYVGSTGLSTGPHLHYELLRNGVQIDPRSVRFITRSQLSGEQLDAFRGRLRGLLALPVGAAGQAQASAPAARPRRG